MIEYNDVDPINYGHTDTYREFFFPSLILSVKYF
jgi:hypothetical protein